MEENSFKSVSMTKSHTNNFSKTIFLPFLSGVIGASLVVGVCFGVPKIKEKILPEQGSTMQNTSYNTNVGSSINPTSISLKGYSETGMGVADKVLPSIVGIKIEYNVSSFFGMSTSTATGSGIIISSDGYILTNNHVVSASSNSSYYSITEAKSIKVTLFNDETEYDAKLIGRDDDTDLAVIKIEKDNLTAAELGDSDSVKVGEFAMAVGCPLGLNTTVTGGMISAVNREVTTSDGGKYTVIQTDAAINSGNSGGALVNHEGKVIGINTLKLSGTGVEGIGFAIPINSTYDITEQLIDHNKVLRPYMGIEGTTVTDEIAQKYNLVKGVYITEIENFGAAQKAGLKVGDVITEVDGETITTMDRLIEIKNDHKIGDKLKLKVNRKNENLDIEITLEEEP